MSGAYNLLGMDIFSFAVIPVFWFLVLVSGSLNQLGKR